MIQGPMTKEEVIRCSRRQLGARSSSQCASSVATTFRDLACFMLVLSMHVPVLVVQLGSKTRSKCFDV